MALGLNAEFEGISTPGSDRDRTKERSAFKGNVLGALIDHFAPSAAPPPPAAETKPRDVTLSAEATKVIQHLSAAPKLEAPDPTKPMEKGSPADIRRDATVRTAQVAMVTREINYAARNERDAAPVAVATAAKSNAMAGQGSLVTSNLPSNTLSQPVGGRGGAKNRSAYETPVAASPADTAVSASFHQAMNTGPGFGKTPGFDAGRAVTAGMSLTDSGITGKLKVEPTALKKLGENARDTTLALNLRAEKGVLAPVIPPPLQAAGMKMVLNGALV